MKPDVDKALAKKEDYEGVEKVIPKQIKDIQLFKYEDKINKTPDDEDENEETLSILKESSLKGSASSGIILPDGCGSVPEGRPGPNKDPVEIDGISNDERVKDTTDNDEECEV